MLSAVQARPALLLRLRLYSTATGGSQPQLKSNVLDELESRGFVADVTSPDLRAHLTTPSVVYVGVDPSASSLHVGNLLPLLGLLHFRARGHKALALIGGATGSIGDPSGRSTERNALSPEELEVNVAGITKQVSRFFERGKEYAKRHGYEPGGSENGYEVVNNYDWFKNISFLDFLRDVGKMARVNTMLARDSVKSRLNSDAGISFTEFSYQLLQAHDFATLYDKHGCRIQLGGSDQWGNIVAGIDLIKRKKSKASAEAGEASTNEVAKDSKDPAFGITIPLLTTSSGEKFGKSAGNAVWLDESRTSVSDFYQFFYRAPDADVEKYLRLLTLVPKEKIDQILAEHYAAPKERIAQRLLADEVTELVHGPNAVTRAQLMAKVMFMTELRSLKAREVLAVLEGDPRFIRLPRKQFKGVPWSKLAATYGLVKSRAEATRIIKPKQSGLSVNDRPIGDPRQELVRTDLIDGHLAILKRGRKDMIVFYVDTDGE